MTKHFIIEEKFTGYANIRIEAETEEQALALYNRGQYLDSDMTWMICSMTMSFVQSQRKKMTFLLTSMKQGENINDNIRYFFIH